MPQSLHPHEIHNQFKDEFINILKKYKENNPKLNLEDFLVFLETINCASLFFLTKDEENQLKILEILFKGIKIRLSEMHEK